MLIASSPASEPAEQARHHMTIGRGHAASAATHVVAGSFNGDIPQQLRDACAIAALQNDQI